MLFITSILYIFLFTASLAIPANYQGINQQKSSLRSSLFSSSQPKSSLFSSSQPKSSLFSKFPKKSNSKSGPALSPLFDKGEPASRSDEPNSNANAPSNIPSNAPSNTPSNAPSNTPSNANTNSCSDSVSQAFSDTISSCGPGTSQIAKAAMDALKSKESKESSALFMQQVGKNSDSLCSSSCLASVQSLIQVMQSDTCSSSKVTASSKLSMAQAGQIAKDSFEAGCKSSSQSTPNSNNIKSSFCFQAQTNLAYNLITRNKAILDDASLVCDACILENPDAPLLLEWKKDIQAASNRICQDSSFPPLNNIPTMPKQQDSIPPTIPNMPNMPKQQDSRLPSRTIANDPTQSTSIPATDSSKGLPNLVRLFNPQCASIITPIIPTLGLQCGNTALEMASMFLNGTIPILAGTIDTLSQSFLGQYCSPACKVQVDALVNGLSTSECSAQLVVPIQNILAPQAASIIKVFTALTCVKDTDDMYCISKQSPRLSQLVTQANDTASFLSTFINNATDITCSPCGIKQQGAVVQLPATKLASGVSEAVVGVIASIQGVCENTPPVGNAVNTSVVNSSLSRRIHVGPVWIIVFLIGLWIL